MPVESLPLLKLKLKQKEKLKERLKPKAVLTSRMATLSGVQGTA